MTKYLTREVYTAMLAAAVVLFFIILSNQFVRFMHYAAAGQFSSHIVTLLLLLQLPIMATILLPLSLFLAILLAYGRLYADNEMTVLQACGISPLRLLGTTLGFSAIVMLLVAILALWFNPKVYNYYDHIMSGATSNAIEVLQPDRFRSIMQGKWVIYVEKASNDKQQLDNFFAAEEPVFNGPDKNKLLNVVMSQGAYQKVDPVTHDTYLVLHDGYRYVGTPGQKDYEIIKYSEYGVKMQPTGTMWQPDASSTPTWLLWHQSSEKLATAELQWRISMPISVLILTLLGTALSRMKPRRGRYAQLAPAVLLYVAYANFMFLAKAWMKKGILSPWLGMWWVHGIMLLIALFLLYKQYFNGVRLRRDV